MEIHPSKFRHKNHELIQNYQRFCQRGQSVRMWTQNSGDVSAPVWQPDVIKALGHVQRCVCVFVLLRGRWLKNWITLFCFILAPAPAQGCKSNTHLHKCKNQSRLLIPIDYYYQKTIKKNNLFPIWSTTENQTQSQEKGSSVLRVQSWYQLLLMFPKSIPCDGSFLQM